MITAHVGWICWERDSIVFIGSLEIVVKLRQKTQFANTWGGFTFRNLPKTNSELKPLKMVARQSFSWQKAYVQGKTRLLVL